MSSKIVNRFTFLFCAKNSSTFLFVQYSLNPSSINIDLYPNLVLIDYLTNEYYSTKQVDKFINQNKDITKFVLRTLQEKSFETKDKKIIKYFDVEIRY